MHPVCHVAQYRLPGIGGPLHAGLVRDLENDACGNQAVVNRLMPPSTVRYGKLRRLFANPIYANGQQMGRH